MTGSSVGAVTWDELYDEASRERLVDEPTKRVDAPERTPFERDRAFCARSTAPSGRSGHPFPCADCLVGVLERAQSTRSAY